MPGAREIRGPRTGAIMPPPKSRARLRRVPPRRPPAWVCPRRDPRPTRRRSATTALLRPDGGCAGGIARGPPQAEGRVGDALQVRRGAFVDGFGLYVCPTIPCPLGLRPQFFGRPCFDFTHLRHLYDLRGPPPIAVFGAPLARAAVGGVAVILYPPVDRSCPGSA